VQRSVAIILLSLTLALFLLLAGFFSVYYDRGQRGMYSQYTGEKKAEVNAILHFLNSHEDVSSLAFLDGAERSHMADVRRVLNGFRITFFTVISLLLLQFYLLLREPSKAGKYRVIRESLLWGGAGALLLVALLAASSLFDFASFWTAFHHILFPQGNWQFPYTSVLITLFPEEFFSRFATQVLLATASYGVICSAASRIRPSS
jgi:integral membrane protein (TIGR01906 family)